MNKENLTYIGYNKDTKQFEVMESFYPDAREYHIYGFIMLDEALHFVKTGERD